MNKIIVFIISLSLFLSSCGVQKLPSDYSSRATKTNEDGIPYSIVYFEGMPCLMVESRTYYGSMVKSISCDWSQWEGNK